MIAPLSDAEIAAMTYSSTNERGRTFARDIRTLAAELLAARTALRYILDHICDPERKPIDLYPAFGLDSTRAIEMARACLPEDK